MQAVDAAAAEGRRAALGIAVHSGASPAEVLTTAADAVTAAVVHSLAEAGCLTEPTPPRPPMTVQDAARLLCALSCSPRLSDPDEDYESLLTADSMVTYAWRAATGAGIPPTQLSDAHEARRLLMEHHRRAARG